MLGLRERKKQDTRRSISRAALLLAVEQGPDAITVDDIAAAADVSPRTVFNYFATKDDAILGIDPERAAEVAALVTSQPAGDPPLATLRAAFVALATANPEMAELARLRAQLVRDHPHLHPRHVAAYSAFESGLVDAIAGRLRLDPDASAYPRLVVTTALAAFRLAVDRADPGERGLVAAIDEAFTLLADGLQPPKRKRSR